MALESERKLGRVLPVEPAEAMLAMVWEATANVAVLRDLVQALDAGRVDDPDGVGLGSTLAIRSGSAQKPNEATPHVWVGMYDAERERLMRWAKACRDAGVDERRIQLAEDQAQLMAQVCKGFAAALLDALVSVVPDGPTRAAVEAHHGQVWPGLMRAELAAVSGAKSSDGGQQ